MYSEQHNKKVKHKESTGTEQREPNTAGHSCTLIANKILLDVVTEALEQIKIESNTKDGTGNNSLTGTVTAFFYNAVGLRNIDLSKDQIKLVDTARTELLRYQPPQEESYDALKNYVINTLNQLSQKIKECRTNHGYSIEGSTVLGGIANIVQRITFFSTTIKELSDTSRFDCSKIADTSKPISTLLEAVLKYLAEGLFGLTDNRYPETRAQKEKCAIQEFTDNFRKLSRDGYLELTFRDIPQSDLEPDDQKCDKIHDLYFAVIQVGMNIRNKNREICVKNGLVASIDIPAFIVPTSLAGFNLPVANPSLGRLEELVHTALQIVLKLYEQDQRLDRWKHSSHKLQMATI